MPDRNSDHDRTDDSDGLSTTRRTVLRGTALGLGVAGLGGLPDLGTAQSDSSGRRFQVRIENVADLDTYPSDASTGGAVWLTPGAYATHNGPNPILTEGQPASSGLEAIAEAGRPGGTQENDSLVGDLRSDDSVTSSGAFTPADTVADPNDPKGAVPGAPPIAPGGAFEFTVDAAPGENFSFASMFVPSNDLFYAPDAGGISLFEGGDPVSGDVTDQITLYDAGTEPNQRPGFGSDQAPAQSSPDQGADEGGVVRPIGDVDDGYSYPSVSDAIRVTVMPVDPTPFEVRIENVADLDTYPSDASTGGAVWLTPGAYATHTGPNPILTEGQSASSGLEAIAEAGRPGGTQENDSLVAELSETSNVSASGAFTPADTAADPNDPKGAVPGAPPIAPGGAFEFTVTAVPGERFSFASMFVPSNDLFYAPDGDGISLFEGGDPVSGDVTDQMTLYDAGTEPNQRPGFGSDQAPAQSSPDQGADEGGVVRPIGDVDDGYSYPSVSDAIQVTLSPSPASRRLGRTAVSAGGSIEVTLSVSLEQAHDRVLLVDTFAGPVSGSAVESITANGSSVPGSNVAVTRASDSGVIAGVESTDPDTTLDVVYTVDVAPDAAPAETIVFGGIGNGPDVSADMVVDAEFGSATATVTAGGAVSRADDDGDGTIDSSELQSAIDEWVRGRFTDSELQRIISAWVRGG